MHHLERSFCILSQVALKVLHTTSKHHEVSSTAFQTLGNTNFCRAFLVNSIFYKKMYFLFLIFQVANCLKWDTYNSLQELLSRSSIKEIYFMFLETSRSCIKHLSPVHKLLDVPMLRTHTNTER